MTIIILLLILAAVILSILLLINKDKYISSEKIKFSLCIATMDRYDDFLSKNLPKYLSNDFIDEITISDENGNDIEKIKQNISKHDLQKFKFNINKERKRAFLNKIEACKLATNEWILLMDSDNFADHEYLSIVDNYLKKNIDKNSKNIILAPSYAKPDFDFTNFSGLCIKKGTFKSMINKSRNNNHNILMNTGNYVINKYLIDNFHLSKDDLEYIKDVKACDVILFNTMLFEKLNLKIHIVPNLSYDHVVHKGSNYLNNHTQNAAKIKEIHERFNKLK